MKDDLKTKVDFDNYVENYDKILADGTDFFTSDTDYFAKYKIAIAKRIIKFVPDSILEFGCGTGRNLKFTEEAFPSAKIFGYDISRESVEYAKLRTNKVQYLHQLDVTAKYDLILMIGVLHHIAPDERTNILNLVCSMLNQTGELLVFEHNPFNPVTKYIVRNCQYDTDAVLLSARETHCLLKTAGFKDARTRYTLFTPPSIGRIFDIDRYLTWLPLGGQYCILAKK